ncbi:twin-arginine translocation pathway signal [Sphingobium lactosutens]|uniref:gluconate 2-dehydrogenase subunit 3 family protein n=1 Tax=Sphingobium lactosutens TaxID=522773 RepID=UPI0015B91BE9|nr:gluconate 2-dehydrogenase subunit 3 family protein [Sphingobium lactosutens]NWK98705.1 twin-arginine translocation pathway signal [Sphingobium lactosutens]
MSTDKATEPRPAVKGADRRQVLGGAVVLSALAGIPLYAWNREREGRDGAGATDSEKLLLARLSDLVVPATGTPGAVAVGVPAFVELALLHGLEDTASEDSGKVKMGGDRGGLPLLEEVKKGLNRHADAPFLTLSPERQHIALESYDAEAFAPEQKDHPWKKIKGLILTGYYTSEVGASRELQYELVPGRYDPDLPLPVNNRSWSSDWTAVDFG